MNPWLLLAWLTAACVALIIVALTIFIVVSVIRELIPHPKRAPKVERVTPIRSSRDHI